MKLSIEKLLFSLLLVAIFLIPFNGIYGFGFLNELTRDATSHVMLLFAISFVIFIFLKKKLSIPRDTAFNLLLLFLIWIFISAAVNFYTFEHTFKGRTGYNKFVLQLSVFLFYGIFVTIFCYSTLRARELEKSFFNIRKVVTISFYVVSAYAFMESMHLININLFEPILRVIDLIIRGPVEFRYMSYGRIRSVSFEPPFLAMYLAFATPWLLSYFHNRNSFRNYLFVGLVVGLVILSGSRSAVFIVFSQLLMYFLLNFNGRVNIRTLIISPLIFIMVLISAHITIEKVYSMSLDKTLSENRLLVSNVSRWANQLTSLKIAKNNPIFGVGLGQQAFYYSEYVPDWAKENSYEVRNWLDEASATIPPGFSIWTRLSAETGLVGTLMFLFFNIVVLLRIWRARQVANKKYLPIVDTILIGYWGFFINYFQFDSFRNFGYWLFFCLFLVLCTEMKQYGNSRIFN